MNKYPWAYRFSMIALIAGVVTLGSSSMFGKPEMLFPLIALTGVSLIAGSARVINKTKSFQHWDSPGIAVFDRLLAYLVIAVGFLVSLGLVIVIPLLWITIKIQQES